MRALDLGRIAEDQHVASPITLRPVGEADEAGGISSTTIGTVSFLIGETITVMSVRPEGIVAVRNYAKPPRSGLPPYVFRTDDIKKVMVKE